VIGVAAEQQELIRQILLKYVPNTEVWIFGSRVKGPVKESSDLDLALYPAKTLSMVEMGLLQDAFSEAALPFKVDCIDTTTITPAFLAIVERVRERFV
jgi:predicted nucleotidyltransferase